VRLRGKNFQSWANFDLDINGLTIVTGPSDVGKSAIFRALKGVLRNELPADFVRDGQDEAMEVAVEIDGQKISANRKRKGSTSYVINGADFAKLAKAIPDELKNLKFNEVIIGEFDVDPIFGRQNSAQFLIDPLTYKPTEVNAILGAFGGTEKLEGGKKEANLRKTQKDAEARLLAAQIRDAEERKAALEGMQAQSQVIGDAVGSLSQDIILLEMDIQYLDEALFCRQALVPLRQIMDALVLPDITGLDDLHKVVCFAEQAALSASFAKWLQKPQAALSSVAEEWAGVRSLVNQIAALEAAVDAGRHVVSTDRLKSSLGTAEATFNEAVVLWRGIRSLEDLSALLRDITDSAERLAGVEIELSAVQAELKKGLCPRCGKPMEHACV
jgi:DNA repair exonuclease SbcCD ATPase subunit